MVLSTADGVALLVEIEAEAEALPEEVGVST